MSKSDDDVSATTRSVVQRLLDAINASDFETVSQLQSPDLHYWSPGTTEIHGHCNSRDEYDAMAGVVFGYLDDSGFDLTIDNLIVGGEYAVAQASGRATTKKGAAYNNSYCLVWRVQDGLITEMTEYNDTDMVRRVLLA
ncbi:MAG: nuclear transport factor 2 family protein [Ilumatobacter sp.]|nr:nuclear transport factor 2 family protein [Ilumatobacter sp.]